MQAAEGSGLDQWQAFAEWIAQRRIVLDMRALEQPLLEVEEPSRGLGGHVA